MENTGSWPIEDGAMVYATDGGKVGTVRNYDPHADYLDVQQGWLFTKDFYVPLSTVKIVTGEGIILRVTKEQLEANHYDTPPVTTGENEHVEDVAVAENTASDEAGSTVIPVLPTH